MMILVLALALVLALHGVITMMRLSFAANRADVARNTQRLERLGPPTKKR